MASDRLNGKKFSVTVVQVATIDSRNGLVLHGQLYITDCKDEGNTLKPYSPEKKTGAVLKMLVRQRAWVPSLVHPHIIK